MIYMIGSNLESVNASATSDLTEIENAGLDYGKANVICYTGGSRRWFSDVPCDRNSILDMSRPAEDRIIAGTEANADMGAPLTLSNFINFCTDYYPAEHYMMIFWDHGGGPIMGYGSDELFSYDALLLTELREAMDETIFAKEKKLDLVGFDACLMGCLENMVLWSDYADYYIGSEELEPGDGWNYAFLSSLNTSSDPVDLGKSVVDMYQSYYEAKISDTYNPDLTLSLIDLSKITQATEAVSAISEVLTDNMTSAGFAEIQRTRSDVKSFGYIAPESEDEDATYYDLADLKDLASNFEDSYPAAAKKVMDAVDAMVVHQYASVSHASGVSFYFPLQNKWMYLGGTDILSATNFSRQYASFLYDYANHWVEAKAHDWLLGALEEGTDSYTLKLTEDQMASATGIYLEVLQLDSFMNYVPVLTGYALDIEDDGTVRVPKDPSLILLSSGKDAYDGSTLWPVSVTEQSEERYVYHLNNTRVYNSLDMDITSRDVIYEDVDVSISSAPDSDEVQIKDVKASSSIGALGKNTIDITGWETLGYNWRGYLPTKGVKGETLPFTQWERDYIGTSYFSIDDGFQIEKKPLSQIHSSFALQVILKDTSGDFYATDIVKVTGIEEQKVSVPTEQGVMEFTISDGEAYLSAYAGNDTKLEIPAKAEDAPVTGIGEVDAYNDTVTEIVFPSSMKKMGYNALSGFNALEKVKLNEGLDTIGSFAFGYTNITELDLPSSVRSIEKCAFAKMRSLTKIDLNSGIEAMHTAVFMDCPALVKVTLDGKDTGDAKGFSLLNGVIYSTDKKSLIAYPGAGPDTYTVEPGTETIEYAAFYGGNVKNVNLPSSLKTIGHFAFYECHQLAMPTLPQGLETIRSQAFGASLYALTVSQDFMTPVKIKIPASVQNIGPGAFDVFQAREFEVDKGNAIYSDLNGALMNLRGDCLIAPASDGRGTLIIPEGALSFEWDMVDYLDNYTDDFLMLDQYDIILPASITQMPIEEYLYTKENLRFHCPVGSVAETYAIEHDIAYDHITDLSFSLEEVKPDDTTVMRFRIYSDHAMLEHVETTSTSLTIPDTVGGQPVTTIGTGTYGLLADPTEMFSYNSNSTVESIQLPATVTEISDDS
ncbi:MAG: leucine-rich repeat protein, partial [Clostridiales bacterium]|nr:leucine-rich repeat protein [Clostridiales bacterium]